MWSIHDPRESCVSVLSIIEDVVETKHWNGNTEWRKGGTSSPFPTPQLFSIQYKETETTLDTTGVKARWLKTSRRFVMSTSVQPLAFIYLYFWTQSWLWSMFVLWTPPYVLLDSAEARQGAEPVAAAVTLFSVWEGRFGPGHRCCTRAQSTTDAVHSHFLKEKKLWQIQQSSICGATAHTSMNRKMQLWFRFFLFIHFGDTKELSV